jgi:predicted MFS family arabinose efflux permease
MRGVPASKMNPYSAAYQRVVVFLLMAAYAFNSMDRNIISIVAPSIKADLKLTDTELGLLGGTAFAMLYALGGIPIARIAERISRVNILTVSLVAWSCLTGLCAAAASFGQLLMIRVGVGVAEAGCSPPAHSLISDYFEPAKRASALSVYSCGISLGYILAAVIGGYIAQHAGWRAACAAVAVPGILTAIVIKAAVREPARGGADPQSAAPALAPFSLRAELTELKAVAAALLVDRPILHMVLGLTIGAFAGYGFYFFIPAYFQRKFDLGSATVGLISALTGGAAVGIGILSGGVVSDYLARSSLRWYALVPALGGAISLPLFALAILANDWRVATAALSLAGFFWYASLGPTFGVVQNVIGARRRATATAFLYICLSVLALGLGPLCVGWIIDRFADSSFAMLGGHGFRKSCLGGMAAAGADASAQSACRSALAVASQRGLLVSAAFFGWAVLHYLLAAVGIGKSLRASLADPAR